MKEIIITVSCIVSIFFGVKKARFYFTREEVFEEFRIFSEKMYNNVLGAKKQKSEMLEDSYKLIGKFIRTTDGKEIKRLCLKKEECAEIVSFLTKSGTSFSREEELLCKDFNEYCKELAKKTEKEKKKGILALELSLCFPILVAILIW